MKSAMRVETNRRGIIAAKFKDPMRALSKIYCPCFAPLVCHFLRTGYTILLQDHQQILSFYRILVGFVTIRLKYLIMHTSITSQVHSIT